jgi:hypothetical protein
MKSLAVLPVLFVGFGPIAHIVFAFAWLQSGFVSGALSVLFWQLARSDERLARVEACLGTDREE